MKFKWNLLYILTPSTALNLFQCCNPLHRIEGPLKCFWFFSKNLNDQNFIQLCSFRWGAISNSMQNPTQEKRFKPVGNHERMLPIQILGWNKALISLQTGPRRSCKQFIVTVIPNRFTLLKGCWFCSNKLQLWKNFDKNLNSVEGLSEIGTWWRGIKQKINLYHQFVWKW